jgi:maltooligosyltrehalose synthase
MQKALHEAKVRTSSINPNIQYDRAIRIFIDQALRGEGDNTLILREAWVPHSNSYSANTSLTICFSSSRVVRSICSLKGVLASPK